MPPAKLHRRTGTKKLTSRIVERLCDSQTEFLEMHAIGKLLEPRRSTFLP
jgi:hypothetical protein